MSLLIPAWPAPKNIKAYSSLRYPGVSQGVYSGLNLGFHVGDDDNHINTNRKLLIKEARCPSEPKWLDQVHSNIPILAETVTTEKQPVDAAYTKKSQVVCTIMTADCLPILVTNKTGTEVAAIHAGWRGLASGIIENTLNALDSEPESLLVWIGPSISQAYYEVGEDVYLAFAKEHSPEECQQAFEPKNNLFDIGNKSNETENFNINTHKKWLANTPLLAKQRLIRFGMNPKDIYLSGECTYSNPEHYFSYRRDGVTGRMASLIWIS